MELKLDQLVIRLPRFSLRLNTTFTARVTGISGPSGSGKTTLLELIAGLKQPQAGAIILDESVLFRADHIDVPPRARRIGYVPQDLALFPHRNVEWNLRYGMGDSHGSRELYDRVLRALELAPLVTRSADELSGGEKQRVALGRALLAAPRLLLLDEPLSSLDDRLKRLALDHLAVIRDEFRIPMLYVSHSARELGEMCDEIVEMESFHIPKEQE